MSVMKTFLFSALCCFVCFSCNSDQATEVADTPPVESNSQPEQEAATPSPVPASASRAPGLSGDIVLDETDEFVMPEVKDFNYITGCDSMVISQLILSDPNGSGEYSYLTGNCVTNKMYEVIAVPRSGHVKTSDFGDTKDVLAKARANGFKDYIVYSLILPKRSNPALGKVFDLLPSNVVVYRLDNTTWHRLGSDRADDQESLKTLRWNILHDATLPYR